MDSKRDTFDRAVTALIAFTPFTCDFSQVLSIIEADTEIEISKRYESFVEFSRTNFALENHVVPLLNDALGGLVTRLPNDEDNTSSILSILNYFCSFSYVANKTVRRFGLLEHLSKILKSRQHEEIIINTCLRLVANLCRQKELFTGDIVMDDSNLNIVKCIVQILWLVLEKNGPSDTTLMLSLLSLRNILINKCSQQEIIDDYGIVKVLGYAMVKFIDDWKTSEENHHTLTIVMQVLELCSEFYYRCIFFELKNTGGGDAMLLLSDLIMIPAVSWTVTNIVSNLLRWCRDYSDVLLDDIFGNFIEKLRNSNAYTNGTDDKLYELFLQNFCLLLNAKSIPGNLIVTATASLLNVLQSHVRPTATSLKNCYIVIGTLQLANFEGCFRFMLNNGILSILSSKLDWIFGDENWRELDLHHDLYQFCGQSGYEKIYERHYNSNTSHAKFNAMGWRCKRKRSPSPRRRAHDYIISPTRSLNLAASTSGTSNQEIDNDELDDLLEDRNVLKRELASEIVNLIEHFSNLKPIALELSSSDIVFKLLLFFLPKNESFKIQRAKKIIRNVLKKPEHSIHFLMQTQFVYMVNKLCIPIHNHCLICLHLYAVGQLIMKEMTKVAEDTIEEGDIASPIVKQTLVITFPFFSKKMATLNNLMITCGGLDVLIDALHRETAQRRFIICSLSVLAQKIQIKDPTDCTSHFDFDDNNDEVTTVFQIENYQPNAGHIVTFKLDDDSCLQADRELLASESDYFNSLLFGQFKESREEVVRLLETPHESFKLVLMLLQLDDIEIDDKFCRNGGKLLERVDLALLLEAIVLCDRFLLKELYMSLTLYMQHCKFSPESMPIIYHWLVDSPAHILRVEIVSYCLVGCMNEEQRNCLFEELLKSENSERLADDLKNTFRRFLCVS